MTADGQLRCRTDHPGWGNPRSACVIVAIKRVYLYKRLISLRFYLKTMNVKDIEKKVLTIEQRNQRVEADKAWETSWTRRIFIMVVTYLIAGVWLVLINDSLPWLKAFVPALGFMLSTVMIPFLKKFWVEHFYQR